MVAPLWPYIPDGAVTERLEWRTNVLQAYPGGEQRIRLREWPRRTFEHNVALVDRDARTAENLLRAHQADVWCLPVWMDSGVLGIAHASGATQITLPHTTAARDYDVGRAVLLRSPTDAHINEVRLVAAVGADTLTLSSSLAAPWPAGTLIMPVRNARIDSSLDLRRFTGASWYGRLGWTLIGSHGCQEASETDYRGYPICDRPSNWDSDPQRTYARDMDIIDAGVGLPYYHARDLIPDTTQSVRWTAEGRTNIAALRRWFYARRGRQKAFWRASGARDLVLMAAAGASDITLIIERCGYADHIAQAIGRRDICIELHDGTRYWRRIVGSAVIDAVTESITIDAALGAQMQPSAVSAISFVELVRLDTDAIDIEWRRWDVVSTAFTVRGVRDDL